MKEKKNLLETHAYSLEYFEKLEQIKKEIENEEEFSNKR